MKVKAAIQTIVVLGQEPELTKPEDLPTKDLQPKILMQDILKSEQPDKMLLDFIAVRYAYSAQDNADTATTEASVSSAHSPLLHDQRRPVQHMLHH